MRPRTVILLLAGALVLGVLLVLGRWVWSYTTPGPVAAQPTVMVVNQPNPTGESENPRPQPAPTARAAPAPVSTDEFAPSVTIDYPQEGQSVPRRFEASGRCGPVPPGHRLMLVIDSGRGVYSPKLPLPEVEAGNWSGPCNDFGAPVGGHISLCVFLVSDDGVRQLAEWQAQGKATGKYPPFREGVPGGVELGRINLTIARN
jgi:hypothetical protein